MDPELMDSDSSGQLSRLIDLNKRLQEEVEKLREERDFLDTELDHLSCDYMELESLLDDARMQMGVSDVKHRDVISLETRLKQSKDRVKDVEDLLIGLNKSQEADRQKIIDLCLEWGGIGDLKNQHWLVDQILRLVTQFDVDSTEKYESIISVYETDGCTWEVGVAPE